MKNILIVDDSALMRRVISDIINKDKQLHTDTYAVNGLDALRILEDSRKFDAIILDINMPKMNGLDLLRMLNKKGRKEKVIIVSTLAKEGARETMEALELGAFDFVTKPDCLADTKGVSFRRMLIAILYAACELDASGISVLPEDGISGNHMFRKPEKTPEVPIVSEPVLYSKGESAKAGRKIVALACSTGGPRALQYVIPFLPPNLDAAVLLVQHMPAGFTESLSNRLDELSHIKVREAQDGDVIQKGTVYIAKGGCQMRLVEKGKSMHYLSVTEETARNGLKPCADIMYESLVKSSFDDITCVVMTGMGTDGTKGIMKLKQTNKIYVIAQEESTCIVYGMPKALVEAGLVDDVQALKNIADAITKHVGVR